MVVQWHQCGFHCIPYRIFVFRKFACGKEIFPPMTWRKPMLACQTSLDLHLQYCCMFAWAWVGELRPGRGVGFGGCHCCYTLPFPNAIYTLSTCHVPILSTSHLHMCPCGSLHMETVAHSLQWCPGCSLWHVAFCTSHEKPKAAGTLILEVPTANGIGPSVN